VKLRSRGLGRRELVMDFREYEIKRDGNEVVIEGTIHEPVTWDFTIRIEPRDIPGMLHVGMNHHTIGLVARWILRRKPHPAEEPRAATAERSSGTETPGARRRISRAERAETSGATSNGAAETRAADGLGLGLKAG